ncbi:MAG TPA: sigma-70 family RNA polymerase sigma factor [Chitinophagaceae bacterium]|nr:sigma-70 family RNA polymerase sigma factor [Chitinophagaceae bacterium]HPH33857.1 sigma-70 family RNA polymerase sigma factor [Chitinophagaceae bacterium]
MDIEQQFTGLKVSDDKVLQYIYVSNYPKVEQYILGNSGTSDDARDIYQEAFLAVWRNVQLDQFRPQNETAIAGYIFQIARNKWLDQLRSVKNKKTTSLPDEISHQMADSPSLGEEELGYLETVKEKYESLGDPCRELLDRFYFKKESMREIAAHFSWTEASAKNNKYRCLQRLRNMVINKKENGIP